MLYKVLFVVAENEVVENAAGGRVVFRHEHDSDRLLAREGCGGVPTGGSWGLHFSLAVGGRDLVGRDT